MKKSSIIANKKAKQDYITNLMLLNTFEGMGVLVLLTLIFKWMNGIDFILLVKPIITGLLAISAVSAGVLAYLTFKIENKKMFPHFIFTEFLVLVLAILYYGFSSPHAIVSYIIACLVAVVYFIGIYILLFMASGNKVSIKYLEKE